MKKIKIIELLKELNEERDNLLFDLVPQAKNDPQDELIKKMNLEIPIVSKIRDYLDREERIFQKILET